MLDCLSCFIHSYRAEIITETETTSLLLDDNNFSITDVLCLCLQWLAKWYETMEALVPHSNGSNFLWSTNLQKRRNVNKRDMYWFEHEHEQVRPCLVTFSILLIRIISFVCATRVRALEVVHLKRVRMSRNCKFSSYGIFFEPLRDNLVI